MAGRPTYSNTLSTLTVSTLTAVSSVTSNVNCSTVITSTIRGASTVPTVQTFTAVGSGTYTPTAGMVCIRAHMCGPGVTEGIGGASPSFLVKQYKQHSL